MSFFQIITDPIGGSIEREQRASGRGAHNYGQVFIPSLGLRSPKQIPIAYTHHPTTNLAEPIKYSTTIHHIIVSSPNERPQQQQLRVVFIASSREQNIVVIVDHDSPQSGSLHIGLEFTRWRRFRHRQWQWKAFLHNN